MSTFATRLRERQLLIGTMLTLPSPETAEIVSKCGFDWLFLDSEHGPASVLDWQRVMQAVAGRAACILRVPSCSEEHIKKALDIGADGIIVPMINTEAQARDAISWTRYSPQGRRGVGLARAHGYGLEFPEYMARANNEIALILQAEHIDAADNIDAIASVEGVDAIFVGPHDLSASLGRMGQLDHPDVLAAIEQITVACKARSMPLGYFGRLAASVKPYVEAGFSLICAGSDAGFVSRGALEVVAELRRG